MRGLPSFLSFFRNEFNKFNNTSTNFRLYLSYAIIYFCEKRLDFAICVTLKALFHKFSENL